jgi:hypothetical protein
VKTTKDSTYDLTGIREHASHATADPGARAGDQGNSTLKALRRHRSCGALCADVRTG